MTQDEVKLFDAPDLAALQRNWPRIALRAGVMVSVPILVSLLARSLDLYQTISALPLPLDFLRAGPFAYEGKVIAMIVAVFLGVAFLIPKRTTALVMAVCVASVLWTGHVFIQLQWAKLFATQFKFRQELVPGPAAWIFATLLLTVGVVFVLIENLLATRDQQEARKLDGTRALFDVGWRTLAQMLAMGAAIAVAMILAYLALRALLADARLPFRLNPVLVLFAMGLGLAVLVAIASRKKSPVDEG